MGEIVYRPSGSHHCHGWYEHRDAPAGTVWLCECGQGWVKMAPGFSSSVSGTYGWRCLHWYDFPEKKKIKAFLAAKQLQADEETVRNWGVVP